MDENKLINNFKETYNSNNFKIIKKAWDFAEKAHHGQKRTSGENYFTHPIAVAGILAELNLDANTIITGLLHDVVEDCDVTIDTILVKFGKEVATLIAGFS